MADARFSPLARFDSPPWLEPAPRRSRTAAAAPERVEMLLHTASGEPAGGGSAATSDSSSAARSRRGDGQAPWGARRMAVSAAHVSRTYGSGATAVPALQDVSLEIPTGTFVAVVGPSGSGKSTLVHCLAGLDVPDRNPATRIVVGGQDIAGLSDDQLTRFRRDHVGFVFQAFNLVPTLTARQNIELPLTLAGTKADATRFGALAATLGLTDRLDHRPEEMSGGQQQRVAIARALLSRPDVVIADEPTGALDTATSQEVLGLLRRCVDELDQTVVVVTHDPVVARAADRVLHVRDGRLVGDEAPAPARSGGGER